jgi:hypothetical protein
MTALKLLSLSIVIAGLATTAYAQPGARRSGGPYNPATETTLSGTIDSVQSPAESGRGPGGVHFMLTAASGAVEVHVGPASFLASKNMTFTKGDAVTVVGSQMTMGGRNVLIAREITKGDHVLTLRDSKGFPLWAGRGRGL